MILIILFIIVPLIAFAIAIYADKKLEKFHIDLQPNEIIHMKEIDVDLEDLTFKKSAKGVLYLTNKKIVLYRYKFEWLELIPLLGNSIVSLSMDENPFIQIPLEEIKNYTFQNDILYRNSRLVYKNCNVRLYSKSNLEYKLTIPLKSVDDERAEILVMMDLLKLA